MKLESETVQVSASLKEVKAFLSQPANYWELLPQDKVSEFKHDDTSCSFKAQGGVVISLVYQGERENEVLLKSGEKSPFPFTLVIHLNQLEKGIEGNLQFDGEVNMFLKMMVEKPLLALFNYMSKKLKEHFDK